MAKLLIDANAETSIQGPRGWAAVHFAAASDRTDLIEVLRSTGFKVRSMSRFNQNQQNDLGSTAMYIACQMGHADVVRCLANDIDSILLRNKAGWSPIHVAAAQGHTKIIQVHTKLIRYKFIKCIQVSISGYFYPTLVGGYFKLLINQIKTLGPMMINSFVTLAG